MLGQRDELADMHRDQRTSDGDGQLLASLAQCSQVRIQLVVRQRSDIVGGDLLGSLGLQSLEVRNFAKT